VPIPFTVNADFDLFGDQLHLVSGTDFRIYVFEAGEVAHIYGLALGPRAVTDADLAAHREFVAEFIPEGLRGDYLSALDHAELPSHLPAYSEVRVSRAGRVWVRVYSSDIMGPASWHVFGRGSEWLGEVRTPASFWVLNVLEDRLVGVWRDDLGVEYVRAYRLGPGRDPL
jgi:hypothetical protein